MLRSSRSATTGSDARFNEALERQDAGDRRAAITALEALCRDDPSYARAWVQLSGLRLQEEDYGGALAAAEQAIRFAPAYLKALINAGIAARGLGDLTAARRYFEQAVRVDRGHPVAQLSLAQVLVGLGKVGEATDAYVRSLGATVREQPKVAWVIEEATTGLAMIEPSQSFDDLLGSLHEGVRWLMASKLARAYQCFEHVRDGPCGLDMPAIREAAETLLGEVWRKRARMTPVPDGAERPPAPRIDLRP